jgi:hypothetical protein
VAREVLLEDDELLGGRGAPGGRRFGRGQRGAVGMTHRVLLKVDKLVTKRLRARSCRDDTVTVSRNSRTAAPSSKRHI